MSSIDPSEELVTEDSFYFASKEDGRVLAVFRLVAGPFGVHELRWGDSKWQP